MKRFLKYSALFLAIVAVLLGCCEIVVRHTPNSYTLKNDWMTQHGSRVRTLITGNSHAYYGIKPSVMGDSIFNIANVTQDHEYDYFLLTKFESQLTNVKNLVVIVDETNIFDPPLEDGKEWFRGIYYKIYYGYDKHSNFSKYNFEISNFSRFTLKCQRIVENFFTGATSRDCDSLGWGCIFTAPDHFDAASMLEDAKFTVEAHKCEDWSRVDYNVQYLNKIGEWCKRRNVNIIVITPPMWEKYVDMVDPKQIAVMHDVINAFVSKYNAKYRDYLRDGRFRGRDFRDSDHLSDLGAEKFSLILKQDFPEL